MNSTDLLLVSGGLDSFLMWRLLGNPSMLYIKAGHCYQKSELRQLAVLTEELWSEGFDVQTSERLYLGDLEQPDGYIPLRNLFYGCVGAIENGNTERIYLGSLRGESSRDKTVKFFTDVSNVLTFLIGREVIFCAPFMNLTKYGLVKAYLEKFDTLRDKQLMEITTSCYNADDIPVGFKGCGECQACFRRWVAMYLNGIPELYVKPPFEWKSYTSLEGIMNGAGRHLPKIPLGHLPGVMENNALAMVAVMRARKEAKKN